MAKSGSTGVEERPRLSRLPGAGALFLVLGVLLGATSGTAFAAEPLPENPARWVTDRAGVLSPGAAAAIDGKLEAFEKAQGSQVLIAIFPKLPEREALEEYTQRVAEAWRVGRAKQDDGVVLFLFVADRALRLEVGYGLEGALTDLESKRILQDTLIPFLRNGDYDGGFAAAADAILVAIQGEYTADPRAAQQRRPGGNGFVFMLVFLVLFILVSSARQRRGGGGNRWTGGGPWTGGGGGFGGGGFGGGGFGGGGFGGGGGSFGGGGASARW
ncbi:MAG: TPM domain-containing protein [Thermoanaerobaculia bacterium]